MIEPAKFKVFLYGQDKMARRQRRFGLAQQARRVRRRGKPPKQLNPQTWAIARSDMLILEPEGKDAENIKLGSTLSVSLWFLAKNKHDGKRRAVSELERTLAA